MIDKAVIISTGDELIEGGVVDTNSPLIAERLSALGIDIAAVLKVGADRRKLHWALGQASTLSNLVIGTGGLGRGSFNLAAEVVAEFLGRKLQPGELVTEPLLDRLEARGPSTGVGNFQQALLPEGSVMIFNPAGPTPGFRTSMGDQKSLIWMPGMPREMVMMLSETVVPWILDQHPTREPRSIYTAKIYGLAETKLSNLLKPLALPEEANLSFREDFPDFSLRLTVGDEQAQAVIFETLKHQIERILAPYIYAEGSETMEEVVGRLLTAKHETLALAESCTGGYISHRITRVAGSSTYYYGGAVTYSNDAKVRYLGVNPRTLKEHGAVSRETALEMSAGVRERLATTIGVGVTGIAGPGGGSREKPVGTVWISIAGSDLHEARLFRFDGDRERIILGASQAALNWLRMNLRDM
ncbi:MAG TPA: CinA family nicotinamide mononucleotide deamidase-related protein [Terriglobales bacterium]|nr:CinA family nicotinamide mononucleotide deamidase-related protein [Terriglobales bacterium]